MRPNIFVLMAGDGQRFANVGYEVPKPLIVAKNKTILEHTLSSLPSIETFSLTFAIRQEHEVSHNVSSFLKQKYGTNINIKIFEKKTRGNLETALETLKEFSVNGPILFLDADNKYDGSNFISFVEKLPALAHAVICCFKPLDDSEKWCFAKINSLQEVEYISEKKKIEDGLPMVGVFYYNDTKTFVDIGNKILSSNQTTKGEFYMSQTIQKFLDEKYQVYGLVVENVVPLGTPEDLEKFVNNKI